MATTQSNQALLPAEPIELTPELTRKRKSQGRLIVERFLRNKVSVAGLIVLLTIVVLVILAPIITGQTRLHDPALDPDIAHKFLGPFTLGHLLGTDDIGRDEFARLLFGGRVSLLVGIATAIMAIGIGVVLGAVAGFYGGFVDTALMRATDVFLSVPLLLILFVLSASFSDGTIKSVVVIIAVFYWPTSARIVRGEFLSLKEREFLLAARTLGANDLRLMFRHILPNAAGPIIVAATLAVGDAILLESTLSFFGFGITAPLATWGNLLTDSRSYITSDPLLTFLPGLAILFTVLSINLVGDGLRDALDPYMTQR